MILIRRRRDPFWISMIVYGGTIVLFHVAVPSSIEARKLYQLVPLMCLLVVAGIDSLAEFFAQNRALRSVLRSAIAGAVLVLFALTGFSLLPEYVPGFGPAVAGLIARLESRGSAVLISSSPQWEDSEAALIAEWASRSRNDGTYLIRGSKLLSHPIAARPGESEFALNFGSQAEILQALSSIPVSFVVLHDTEARLQYPHQALLKAALAGDTAEWEPIYRSERRLAGLGQTHTIEIYRCRRNLVGVPIHYSVDLTRKLGEKIGTP
jgi:hypothetical protein